MRAERAWVGLAVIALALTARPASADYAFSTGDPDGKMATASRPGGSEIESADDFLLGSATRLTSATFTGLLPSGATMASVLDVHVEIYRVFPDDSTVPPDTNVPTRANSPSDVAFDERSSSGGNLSFTTSVLNTSFTASNSVLTGINAFPNQFTGGEGAVSGQEVQFSVNFTTPINLPADHYFFVPQVLLSSGDFLWLSAAKPIASPGTPFTPDLQTWIRDDSLSPDWLRVGTDITHQGPFNASFSLAGRAVPEPTSLTLIGLGGLAMAGLSRRKARATCSKG